jgi:hypothetical protein
MTDRWRRKAGVAAALAIGLLAGTTALAQGRTDVVTLGNGDRITGEIMNLQRGRLEFKTDDAGTLYLEWDKLVSVVTTRFVEVTTVTGASLLGTLGPAPSRAIAVVGSEGTSSLLMIDVTEIRTIGRSFWKQLDGSIDAGFSYTRSSGVAQLNFNSDTVYRKPRFQFSVTAAATQTRKDDDSDKDDRASLEFAYLRYRWTNWYIGGAARFETNESLGLILRSQVLGAVGPRLVNTNRAQLSVGAGLAANEERGLGVEPTTNLEGVFLFQTSYYTYDRPKTNVDIVVQYYPSLSNAGRHRLQVDAGVKREILKDLFVSLNGFNSYDSRPPNPAANTNDVGVSLSIGWSY